MKASGWGVEQLSEPLPPPSLQLVPLYSMKCYFSGHFKSENAQTIMKFIKYSKPGAKFSGFKYRDKGKFNVAIALKRH